MSTAPTPKTGNGGGFSRRDFLVASGGAGVGLVLGFAFPALRRPGSTQEFQPNAFVRIAPTGAVTIAVTRQEMGQGVRTSLPMILADELGADWSKVQIEIPPAMLSRYGSQGTGGSSSIREMFDPLRYAGAAAREMLISAAANRWGAPRAELRAEDGHIVHKDGRKLSFGELAADAAKLPIPHQDALNLKPARDFKIIGRPIPRLDTPAKLNGSAIYGMDVKVPGMKYAALARCPYFGGKLKSFNDAEAKKVTGVRQVLQMDDSVVVLADHTWAAFEGRRALDIQWDPGPNGDLSTASIFEMFREKGKGSGWVMQQNGDVSKAPGRRLEAAYSLPFVAHAPMEPQNCTAHFKGESCELWVSTQVPDRARRAVAEAIGLPQDKVTVNVTLIGGGFGRRLRVDYALEAAQISKTTGVPVKVVWSRPDDMRHDLYRPASLHLCSGAVDAQGWPVGFHHKFVGPSIGGQVNPEIVKTGEDGTVFALSPFLYAVANYRSEYLLQQTPVIIGPWRSVYASQSGFAVETFLDELAALGRRDPLEVRRRLLDTEMAVNAGESKYFSRRLKAVVELAAEKAGWGTPLPKGHARGIACHASFFTYAAVVCEVSVEGGNVRVHRAVAAADLGYVVNPDTVEAQMQSAVIFSLSAALKGEITLEAGRIKQGNFDDFEVLRLPDSPRIEAYTVKSNEDPTGIGEPVVPPTAAAVANAVFAATGKPVRSLPIRV